MLPQLLTIHKKVHETVGFSPGFSHNETMEQRDNKEWKGFSTFSLRSPVTTETSDSTETELKLHLYRWLCLCFTQEKKYATELMSRGQDQGGRTLWGKFFGLTIYALGAVVCAPGLSKDLDS